MPSTIVLQSHKRPLPYPWLERCTDSVRAWAEQRGFAHRLIDDALFGFAPQDLQDKFRAQPVVVTDIARLRALAALRDQEGFEVVIWADADMLVFEPERLSLPEASCAVGREVWVQLQDGRLKTYTKVHNAFLMFRKESALLDFYIETAERLLRAHPGPVVPQFVGPKLLTALHNAVHLPVLEEAGMLSPLVAQGIAVGGSEALARFREKRAVAPAALNLCTSLEESRAVAPKVIERLLTGHVPL